MRQLGLVVLATLALGACRAGDEVPTSADGMPADVDAQADAATADAAVDAARDAATVDGPAVDAAAIDARAVDAAIDAPPIDSANIDAPPIDAPPIDAPPIDAPPIDAAPIDAPAIDAGAIDATPPDAAAGTIDAACTGGGVDCPAPPPAWLTALAPLDIEPGTSLFGLQAAPASLDGAVHYCLDETYAGDPQYTVRRNVPGGSIGEFNWLLAGCAVAAVDDLRAVVVKSPTWPGPVPRPVLLADFATGMTELDLTTVAPEYAYRALRIPTGFLVFGKGIDAAQQPVELVWRLDGAFTVVATHTAPWPGSSSASPVVVPGPGPLRIARVVAASTVTIVDVATWQTVDSVAVPLDEVRTLLPGRGEVIVAGRVGGQVGIVPLGSGVATILPSTPAGWAAAIDHEGRVVVAQAVGDNQTLEIRRIDLDRFDGMDGASRLDPSVGPGGLARAAFGVACAPATYPCNEFARYQLGSATIADNRALVVAASFRDIYSSHSAPGLQWFALPP